MASANGFNEFIESLEGNLEESRKRKQIKNAEAYAKGLKAQENRELAEGLRFIRPNNNVNARLNREVAHLDELNFSAVNDPELMAMPEWEKKLKIKMGEMTVHRLYDYVNVLFDTKLGDLIRRKSTADKIYPKVKFILGDLRNNFSFTNIMVEDSDIQKLLLKMCKYDIERLTGDLRKGSRRLFWLIKFYNVYNSGGKQIGFGELPDLENTGYLMTSNAVNASADRLNKSVEPASPRVNSTSPIALTSQRGGKRKTKKDEKVKKTKKRKGKKSKKTKKRKY